MTRSTLLALAAVAVLACAKKTPAPAADTTAMAPPPPPPISLADVAGKWTVRAMPEVGDSTLLTYELQATADTAGWTMTLPGRKPIPIRVMPMADSLMISAGPYPSALRKGVQVTTEGVVRLQNGMLVGTTVAHYSAGPDSVLRIRLAGTRAP